jgi:hypothetical protein
MIKEPIPRGVPGLIHPITGSYILLDDDGNIRIGLEQFGDVFFVKGTTGEVFINSNKVRFIVDEIEWNELVFNKASVSPSQPALMPKKESILNKELTRYAK